LNPNSPSFQNASLNTNNPATSSPNNNSLDLGFNSTINRPTSSNNYNSPYNGNIPMYQPLDNNIKKDDPKDTFVSIEMDNTPPNGSLGLGNIIGGEQQQLLANPVHTEYLESRSQAIDSIESTIAELGQIYQHFAQILAGQRETVQRIDDNIADVEMNVEGAQNQLMKYYNNISNNRWLLLKALGIVLIFFLIFVMFL